MIINKVILTNFRNHKYREVSFVKGVNLLLGMNGAGKSSILEAIGYALFNDKKLIRNNLADVVTEGEKKGHILVEFTADDGETYIVEKSLPSGSGQLYLKDKKNRKITGKAAIQTKLLELLGLKINSESFFSNVIVASQNKITDIFIGTTDERRARFDKLFDTEIYRQISEGYLKQVQDEFKIDISKKNDKINELKNIIIEPEILSAEKSEIQKKYDDNQIVRNELLTKIESLQESKNLQLDYKNRLETNTNLLTITNERKTEAEKNIIKLNKSLESANLALITVEKNRDNYDKYLSLENEIKSSEDEITKLEKISKKNDKLKKELNDSENELNSLNSELAAKEERKIELFNEHSKIIENGKNLSDELAGINANVDNLNKVYFQLDSVFKSVKDFENEIIKIQKEINDYEVEHSSIQNSRHDDAELENLLLQLNDSLAQLKPLLIEKKGLEKSVAEIKIRLNENSLASNTLSGGICPFLTENCLNISQGSSVTEYFSKKSAKLEAEFAVINSRLEELKDAEKNEKQIRNQLSRTEQLKQSNDDGLKKIEKLEDKILTSKANSENLKLKIDLLFSENRTFFNNNQLVIKQNISDELTYYKDDFKAKISNLSTIADEKNKQLKLNSKEIEAKNIEIEKNQRRIFSINSELVSISEKSKKVKEKIEENEEILKLLDGLKTIVNTKKTERDNLKNDYNEYLKNLSEAKKIDSITNEINQTKTDIDNFIIKEDELRSAVEDLKTLYSEEKFIQLSAELELIKSQHKNAEEEFHRSGIELSKITEKISFNNSNIENLKENEHVYNYINKKFQLAGMLRTNLKTMGQFIANKFMERIEHIATENYRLMSGRTESILWKSNVVDAYQVALKLKSGTVRNFELLSGGEQMMVALSLRAAMNTLLTNSKFVIFDEPTVNLDIDKRRALSESLAYILKNSDQAIIVTHDNTFIENASTVINL